MAGLAVNADPSIQPPYPLLRLLFFRKSIIDTVSAPYDEEPISDLMGGTGGVLADSAIDEQFADFERLFLAGFRTEIHGAPLTESYGMGFGNSKAAARQQQKADEYASQVHGCGQLYDLTTERVEICKRRRFGLLETD
jgi:hypothetical protein